MPYSWTRNNFQCSTALPNLCQRIEKNERLWKILILPILIRKARFKGISLASIFQHFLHLEESIEPNQCILQRYSTEFSENLTPNIHAEIKWTDFKEKLPINGKGASNQRRRSKWHRCHVPDSVNFSSWYRPHFVIHVEANVINQSFVIRRVFQRCNIDHVNTWQSDHWTIAGNTG